MNFRTALGHTLRTERTRLGLTLRAVSTKSHITIAFLSEIERGNKEIASEYVALWASALGLEPYEVYLRTAYLMAGQEIIIPDTAEELLTLTVK